jgi:hypothetical protein
MPNPCLFVDLGWMRVCGIEFMTFCLIDVWILPLLYSRLLVIIVVESSQ